VILLADYLRKIEPRQVDNRGRYKPVPESRLRTFAAAREVLTNNKMTTATLAAAVAITTTAAHKHGADVGQVWKLVRRYRELIHEHAEQLTLPLTRP
jgi:hypothetical protein